MEPDPFPNRKARLANAKRLRTLAKLARKRVKVLEAKERAARAFNIQDFEEV
jgi:hypothetical protein